MITNTKPTLIIDSSALMAHLLQEPHNDEHITVAIQSFYLSQSKFVAPIILPFEVGNVLKSCVKSKRITKSEGNKLYNHYLKLPIKYVPLNPKNIFPICLRTDLTYYDASYLCLYKSTHYPLLTLDKELLSLTRSL